MIVAAKALGVMAATIVALFAMLLGLASGLAHGSTDPIERRQAALTAFWSLVVFALCALVIVSLTGCSTGRALYDACRDGLCR
jgi:purine-cytosine permease-like protein